MDFRHLTDCFEGTVFADDYRTNLKTASEQIAALEPRASANSKGNDRTKLLLVQAVYSSICGDFVSADSYLGQLSSIAQSTNDSSLLARCNVYNIHIQCTRNVPPFLRFRVDYDTGPAIVRGIGISAWHAQVLRQRIERGALELSSLEKFEANILVRCTSFLNDLWLEAFPEHPQYQKDLPIVLFEKERNYWDNVRQLGDGTNFPAIASYLNQLTLQYRLAGDASNARSSLLSIYKDVLERGNLIAAACCQLQLGDAILSPPFTSPLALNLISVVSELGWDNDRWDKRQQEFPLKQDAEAMQCYQQAHFHFEAGGSGRGMAAVLLRHACLDLAEYMMEPTRNDAKAEESSVQSAYNHLTAAKGLFEGDITNTLIVDSYFAICNIFLEEFPTALEICFNIGEIGKRTGNSCTCEFVGFLHLRLARRLLAFGKVQVKHARVLCACATVCFKGLDDPYLELHAVAASAILNQRRGDIPTATKHVQYGRNLLELTAIYFDNLQAQVESLRIFHEEQEQRWLNHDSEMLQAKHTSCVIDFDRLASSVSNSRSNTQNRSLSSSNQLSSVVSMLQSFSLCGIDPSSIAALQSLMPGVESIDVMRQKYEDAIKSRRDELVNNADIDAAEKHLTDFVQELDKLHIFSEELDTMKTAALQYLGDYNRAMKTITRILPTSFGGTRDPLPILEGTSKQIRDVMDKAERQKFDRAVSLCFAAKDWKRGMTGVQAMLQRDVTSLDDMKKSEDPHIWYNMVCIASMLEHNMELGLAFEWYLGAFHVIEAYRQQLADIEDRRDILSTISSGEIFLGLARIAFHFSQTHNGPCGPSQQWILTPTEWKDQILRFLELGRSRTLLDLLITQELASEEDFRKWSDYSYELRLQESPSRGELTAKTNSEDCTGSKSEDREKYLKRIYDELEKEWELENPSTFLSKSVAVRESNAKLYQSIPDTAIVLHISSGREGLMILCITSQGIIEIHTSELTGLQLDRHIFRFTKLFRNAKGLDDSSLPTIATCNQHIEAISDALIEPVAQHIKMKEHVIFIPSPSLNKFPLCVLVYNKEPLFLSKDVSQVPSLSVLQYLVDKKRHNNKKVNVIYKNRSLGDVSLVVSTSAAIHIARSFHTMPQATTEELTRGNLTNIYQQSDVLLVATHDTIGLKSAWESYLSLQEQFLVKEIAAAARQYISSQEVQKQMQACVAIAGRDINDGTVRSQSAGHDWINRDQNMRTGKTEDLDKANQISQEAVEATPADPGRARWPSNLGIRRGGNPRDLESQIYGKQSRREHSPQAVHPLRKLPDPTDPRVPLIEAHIVRETDSLASPGNELSPLLGSSVMKAPSAGKITELKPGVFQVITRGHYGHIFEDVVRVDNRREAEEYFQHMNDHVPILKRPFVAPSWIQNFVWIFSPPKAPGLANESMENPQNSRGYLWNEAGEDRGKTNVKANDVESARREEEERHVEGPVTREPRLEATVDQAGNEPQQAPVQHIQEPNLESNRCHYLCVSIGRKQSFALHQLKLPSVPNTLEQDQNLSNILEQDQKLFKALLAFIYERLRRSRVRQFVFPLTFSKIEFWEFKLKGRTLVELPHESWMGKLPNDLAPTEEPSGCESRKLDDWRYTTDSGCNSKHRKAYLGQDRLTCYVRYPHAVDANAQGYAARWIPYKRDKELSPTGEHIHGWGLVVYEKFDYLTFTLVWSLMALSIAGIIVVVLVELGPLRGNVSGICSIMFGFVTVVNVLGFTTAMTYARAEDLWPK